MILVCLAEKIVSDRVQSSVFVSDRCNSVMYPAEDLVYTPD